uniref:Uncharacterized protein n=1 Tax=Lotus japonicus TaxID=34305 RepID=I3S8N1_LOTJA|nr:unknown [Lotus japonicus]
MEKLSFSSPAEWWQNIMYPVRRVWFRLAHRFGIRKTGLLKLRHDVRACEYDDIRVMWEMLNGNESEFVQSQSPGKSKKYHWKLFRWARCAQYNPDHAV